MHSRQDSARAPEFLTRRPVQTRQQQILLARQVQAWQGHPDGPDGAPAAVRRRGQRAQRILVEGNMRLVLKMVRGFEGRGVDYDDLVQAGAIGLMTAARKFDPSRGHAFSTYAVWWIRQALQRESRKGHAIALPLHSSELAFRALATATRLESSGEGPATLAQVSAALDGRWSPKQLGNAVAVLHRCRVRSLNSRPRDVEDGCELLELVGGDQPAEQAWERLIEAEDRQRLQVLVQQLDARTRLALQKVYGEGATLASVAQQEGVSRETVREWLVKARHQLRLQFEAIPSGQRQQADGAPEPKRRRRQRSVVAA